MPRSSAVLSGILTLLAVLVLWQVASVVFAIPDYVVPAPYAVLEEIAKRPGFYLVQSAVTLRSTLIGFVAATLIGIGVGTVTAYSKVCRQTLYPLILLLQGVPKVALAPVLIVFFGFGLEFQVVVVASIAFFPVVINTVLGLTSVDRDLILLSRVLRTPRLREFLMIGLPHAAPSIFSGMKVAMTLSVIGAVVSEFVSSEAGLGHTLIVANSEFNTAMSFAAILLLSLMTFALFGVLRLLERLVVPWSEEAAIQIEL
ncbi:MAG: ABC transporter permease [Proteobacteria bacterium]|nr:ABC transporter permease [Pseudomonadota bacterium]